MRFIYRGLLVILVLTLLGACASKPEYTQNFSPTTDFSQYKTWQWSDNKPILADKLIGEDPMVRLVRKAITDDLEAKGMKMVMENPDVLVQYRGNVFQAVSASPEKTGYSSQLAWEKQDSGSWFRRSSREGVLTIFLLDPENSQPVWTGTGREPIADQSEARRKVPGVVRRILAAYPPTRR